VYPALLSSSYFERIRREREGDGKRESGKEGEGA